MELSIIQSKIYEIRGYKVMLDFDLAAIYGIETRVLKQAVRRNLKRFAGNDFMFELTRNELLELSRSQIVTLNGGRGSNIKYLPFAFTELGVAMLSSVLNSDTAIETNRGIMRAFVAVRHLLALPVSEAKIRELAEKINEILQQQDKMDSFMYEEFGRVYEIIGGLAEQKKEQGKPRKRIGF